MYYVFTLEAATASTLPSTSAPIECRPLSLEGVKLSSSRSRNRSSSCEGNGLLGFCCATFIAIFTCIPLPVSAQSGNRPWEEYGRHIDSSSKVKPYGNDLFGDSVDLYNGRLSFRHVDVDISGNSSLPVTLARTFNVADPIAADENANVALPDSRDLPFANWELDVPRVSTTYAYQLVGNVIGPGGLDPNPERNYTWPDQRCSGKRVPPPIGQFFGSEYWNGIQASMPGGGELLQPAPGVSAPSSGGPYRWVTSGFTWVSCLPAIKNTSGEGFLAITSDGTKYWFDWMAAYAETTIRTSYEYQIWTPSGGFSEIFEQELTRRRHVLYATRVEDRFGNWVTYAYSNAAGAPARLTGIQSSDGRQIALTYDATGRIATASANGRTWSYQYASNPNRLISVTQPDLRQWVFQLEDVARYIAIDQNQPPSCSYPGTPESVWRNFDSQLPLTGNTTLTIAHPTGAIGEFEISPRLHGRSHVPASCQPVPEAYWMPENGSYSDYVRIYWTNALVGKRISGAGLSSAQWGYLYNNTQKINEARSGFTSGYSAPGSWAATPYTWTRLPEEGMPLTDISTYLIVDPKCTSIVCASSVSTEVSGPDGTWSRYTFGNSYRYDENKLLKVETGTGPGAIKRVENQGYSLAQSGQPYPTPIGFTRQYKGDTILNAALRPSSSTVIVQDGRTFNSVVNGFDSFGRPLNVTKSSAPSP